MRALSAVQAGGLQAQALFVLFQLMQGGFVRDAHQRQHSQAAAQVLARVQILQQEHAVGGRRQQARTAELIPLHGHMAVAEQGGGSALLQAPLQGRHEAQLFVRHQLGWFSDLQGHPGAVEAMQAAEEALQGLADLLIQGLGHDLKAELFFLGGELVLERQAPRQSG